MIKLKSFENSCNNRPAPKVFSYYSDNYIYDESSGLLQKSPVPLNDFERIQSYYSTVLDRVLDHFGVFDSSAPVDDSSKLQKLVSDLSEIGILYDRAEEIRAQYCLDDSFSVLDVYNYLSEKSSSLKKELENKILDKEGKNNEEKT